MAKSFPKLMTENKPSIKDNQRILNSQIFKMFKNIKNARNLYLGILFSMQKTKYKEIVLKEARGKICDTLLQRYEDRNCSEILAQSMKALKELNI